MILDSLFYFIFIFREEEERERDPDRDLRTPPLQISLETCWAYKYELNNYNFGTSGLCMVGAGTTSGPTKTSDYVAWVFSVDSL